MREKKRWFRKVDNRGFSLIEVLVALMILLAASQMLVLGISFVTKMNDRIDRIEEAHRNMGIHLYEKSSCRFGTVRMEFGDEMETLEKSGWLYTGEELGTEVPMNIVWVEEPAWKGIKGQ